MKKLNMTFINFAMANDAANNAAPSFHGFVGSIVPLLIFVAIFYLLLIRPQQKKQQEHEKEVAGLKPNDNVLTAGGIYGKIVKIKEEGLLVEISEGVEIVVVPNTVSLVKKDKKEEITIDKKPSNSKKSANSKKK